MNIVAEHLGNGLWRYGPEGSDPQRWPLLDTARYRHTHDIGTEADEPGHFPAVGDPLLPTAICMIRLAGPDEDRLVYDPDTVRWTPAPSATNRAASGEHIRSTAGRAKAPGETLAERAARSNRSAPSGR